MPKKIFDIIPPSDIRGTRVKESTRSVAYTEKISRNEGFAGKKRIILKIVIFSLVFSVLAGVFSYAHFSKTIIIVWPERDTLTLRTTLTVDSEAEAPDFEAKVLPAKIFTDQKSASQDFSSSGKVLKEEKASGIIRVYNNYYLTQTLVAKTRFQPPLEEFQPSLERGESPWFRTAERITIPPKGYKDVKVIADSPGEKYNIKPSKFSIPGLRGLPQYTLVYGESFQEFKGGFRGEVPQVTKDDLERARNILVEEVKKESREFLKKIVPADSVLLEEAISQEIVEEDCSADQGSEAKLFTYQVKIKSKGISFKKSDIESFAKNLISLNIPEDKKFQEKSLKIDYLPGAVIREEEDGDAEDEGARVALNLAIRAKIYSNIDLATLKKALLGKTLKESQMLLENHPQIAKIEIKSWPFWKKRIPENIEKIEIRVNLD